ncbi:hypothetical protein [Nitrosospira multiformis]|uniref:Uncharacterized protein n=1 Tax=Nitrosospira multiformis TaxID=1231 RepID=A0A1I7I369_9PROT|nr:hypothetical protein [Nitrosospira multiformis]SFU67378.1 hypothetical protein SAMN05216417_1144 [Nitrosospira multiformis]
MTTEIFRFMTLRPPQEGDSETVMKNTLNLNDSTSEFIELLVQQKKGDSRAGIEKLVQGFLISNNSGFIDSRKKVDVKFLSFYESLLKLKEKEFHKAAKDLFIKIFNVEPEKFVQQDDFKEVLLKVTDSMVIAAIEQNIESRVRSLLISLAKTLGLIQKLAYLEENQVYSKADFLSQIIMLPEGIFPLPTIKQDLSELLKAEEERLKKIANNQAELLRLSKELTANRNAVNDLLTTFERSIAQSNPAKASSTPHSVISNRDRAHSGFGLSERVADSLRQETKATLRKIGLEPSNIDVAMAISLIEKQSREINNRLYASRSSMRYVVSIGNNLVASDIFVGEMPIELENPVTEPGTPGVCPPVSATNITDEVTVPHGTHGEARVLGFADLMVVEQELVGYRLGEIAHIEKCLKKRD